MKQATAKWNRKIPVIFPYYTKVEHRRHEVSRSGEVATPNLRGALRGDIPPKNILVRVKKINAWRLNITSEFNEVAEGDLGEERILLGKIAEGGRSEPLNSC